MKTVYVAGPYSSDPENNTQEAIRIGHILMDMGFSPFIPHLTHYMELQRSRPYEEWLAMDNEFVIKCDCLLRIPGESSGADKEVELAKKHGIPVLYDIEELKEAANV